MHDDDVNNDDAKQPSQKSGETKNFLKNGS